MNRATLPNARLVGAGLPWQRPLEVGQPEPPVNVRDEVRLPRPLFVVLHNGMPIPGVEHATKQAAMGAALKPSALCGTAIECFRVEQRTPPAKCLDCSAPCGDDDRCEECAHQRRLELDDEHATEGL